MWLTSYDSCSSWSVINHESKIHPKPTLLWDFKQWWALDSPIFLLCPPGLIRSDERTAPVLSELVKMFHKVIVFSLTLFFSIYLYHNFLLGQLMAPFANEQCVLFCFVLFCFLAYHPCKTKWGTTTSNILLRLLFLLNSRSAKNHRSIHCWVV